jgi:cytochrome c peroxidase
MNDVGRFEITKDSADLGKFKVPGLRNIALTAPYMHNGMFQTLEEVIEFYDNPYNFIDSPINIDPLLLEPLELTETEKQDLRNYLDALTDEGLVE